MSHDHELYAGLSQGTKPCQGDRRDEENAGAAARLVGEAKAQLRWQCRRGMRELDELLLRYLDSTYAGAGDAEKAAFRALLTLPDPELISYLLGQQSPPSELASVTERIRRGTQACSWSARLVWRQRSTSLRNRHLDYFQTARNGGPPVARRCWMGSGGWRTRCPGYRSAVPLLPAQLLRQRVGFAAGQIR